MLTATLISGTFDYLSFLIEIVPSLEACPSVRRIEN